MLANLSLVNCYDHKNLNDPSRKQIMLNSAKENLAKLAFFGVKGHQNETQYLFEQTFGIKFKDDISKFKPKTIHSTVQYYDTLHPDVQYRIEQKNDLDIQLYDYAVQLFTKRLEYSHSIDHSRT